MSKTGLIINFLAFIAAILLAIFFALPKYEEIKIKQADKRVKSDNIENLKIILQKTEKLKNEIENKEEDIKLVEKILPSSRDIPLLIVNLEEMANSNGLVLEKLDIKSVGAAKEGQLEFGSKIPEADSIKEMQLGLTLTGNYDAFKSFVVQLENNARMLNLEKISFDASSDLETDKGQDFNLDVKTFYRPTEK